MSTNTFQALNAELITPSDTNNITTGGAAIASTDTGVCLYVGTGGDVAVTMVGNNQKVIFYNVPNGSFLPIQVNKVWDTDTNASDILALY